MCGGANGLIWRSSREHKNPANGSGYRKFRRIQRGSSAALAEGRSGKRTNGEATRRNHETGENGFLAPLPKHSCEGTQCYRRVSKKSARDAAATIPEQDRDTIESHMIRFRFGPWDPRYRKWLSILVAKQLAIVYLEGRTVKIQLSIAGVALAEELAETEAFRPITERAKLVNLAVGSMAPTKITSFR